MTIEKPTEIRTELKSETNKERLKSLTAILGFSSLRLMVDPQKSPSTEAVIEDVCDYLEEQNNGFKKSEHQFSIRCS